MANPLERRDYIIRPYDGLDALYGFYSSDLYLKSYSLDLITDLVKKNQALEEATKIAKILVTENDQQFSWSRHEILTQLKKNNINLSEIKDLQNILV